MPITRDKTMDPGLGEPVAQNASSIEGNKEEETEQDYLGPKYAPFCSGFAAQSGTRKRDMMTLTRR
jgi:hypothetical protein